MYIKKDFKSYINDENLTNKYDYAIIDPPWNYDSKPYAVMRNQLTYNLWDNEDLHDVFNQLNVDFIFLWATNSLLPDIFELTKDTPFEYKSMLTWVKLTAKNNLFWGLGNTLRNCTEQLLVFKRKSNKIKALNLSMRNVIHKPAGKRTVKPKDFEKDLVDKLSAKGMSGIYLFSGGELDFIDCVDIV